MIRTRIPVSALAMVTLVLAACDGDATGSDGPDPTAVDATFTSFRNQTTSVEIAVTGTSSALPVRLLVPPANGSLDPLPSTLSGTATLGYTPHDGFVGTDDLVYEVGTGAAASQGRVRILVRNRAPAAADGEVSTLAGTSVEIELDASDADGDALTITAFQQPAHGTLGPIVPTGPTTATVTYTPDAGFLGTDAFTFRAADGIDRSEPARIEVDVPSEVGAVSRTVVTDEDRAITFDLEVENPGGVAVGFAITGPPSNGHLTGSFLTSGVDADPAVQRITYVPNAEFSGGDAFTFEATTSNGAPSSATIDIEVRPVNDPPSFTAGPDLVVTASDPPQVESDWATGISAGPGETFGPDGRFRVFVDRPDLFRAPVEIALDGTLRFTPARRNSGVAAITVELDDGDGAITATQTFTIEVLPAPIGATFHQERFEAKTGTAPAVAPGPSRVRYAFVMEGYQDDTPDRGYSDFTIGGVSGTKLANEFFEFNPAEQLSMFEVWRWSTPEVDSFSDLDYALTGGGDPSAPRLVVFVDVVSAHPVDLERAIVSAESLLDLTVAAEPGDLIIDAYGLRSGGGGDVSVSYDSGQTERYFQADPLDDFSDPSSVLVALAEKQATSTSEDLHATGTFLTTPHYRIVIVVAPDDGM